MTATDDLGAQIGQIMLDAVTGIQRLAVTYAAQQAALAVTPRSVVGEPGAELISAEALNDFLAEIGFLTVRQQPGRTVIALAERINQLHRDALADHGCPGYVHWTSPEAWSWTAPAEPVRACTTVRPGPLPADPEPPTLARVAARAATAYSETHGALTWDVSELAAVIWRAVEPLLFVDGQIVLPWPDLPGAPPLDEVHAAWRHGYALGRDDELAGLPLRTEQPTDDPRPTVTDPGGPRCGGCGNQVTGHDGHCLECGTTPDGQPLPDFVTGAQLASMVQALGADAAARRLSRDHAEELARAARHQVQAREEPDGTLTAYGALLHTIRSIMRDTGHDDPIATVGVKRLADHHHQLVQALGEVLGQFTTGEPPDESLRSGWVNPEHFDRWRAVLAGAAPKPEPGWQALLMAGRHLDPEEGVMRIGHVVDDLDLGALRKVLSFVAGQIRVTS